MIKVQSSLGLFVLFIVLFQSDLKAVLYFKDGGQHTIDYKITETVSIDWASPGKKTELYVVDGAEIIDNHTGTGIAVYEDGVVYISGGSITRNVVSYGRSKVFFSGGTITQNLAASEHSEVYVSDGIISCVLGAYSDGTVYLSGGKIGNELSAFSNGKIFVTGGELGMPIRASNTSTIVIYGTDFNYDYGEISVTNGKLTGTLANGDTISNYFYINDDAKIILVIPEPSTLLLLGLGTMVLRRKSRRSWMSTRRGRRNGRRTKMF